MSPIHPFFLLIPILSIQQYVADLPPSILTMTMRTTSKEAHVTMNNIVIIPKRMKSRMKSSQAMKAWPAQMMLDLSTLLSSTRPSSNKGLLLRYVGSMSLHIYSSITSQIPRWSDRAARHPSKQPFDKDNDDDVAQTRVPSATGDADLTTTSEFDVDFGGHDNNEDQPVQESDGSDMNISLKVSFRLCCLHPNLL